FARASAVWSMYGYTVCGRKAGTWIFNPRLPFTSDAEPDACVPSVTVTPTLVIAYSCSRRVRGRTSGRSARLIVDVPAGTRIMYASPHEGVTTTPQSDDPSTVCTAAEYTGRRTCARPSTRRTFTPPGRRMTSSFGTRSA